MSKTTLHQNTKALRTKVVIIGAGISGINVSIELQKQLNLNDFLVIEKSASVGGTW